MRGKKPVPRTDDPDEDAYPHYYGGEPSGYIHSPLVYADDISGLEHGTIGAGPWDDHVNVSIENHGEEIDVCASVELSPDDARKLAHSLMLSAEWAEKERSRK